MFASRVAAWVFNEIPSETRSVPLYTKLSFVADARAMYSASMLLTAAEFCFFDS